MSEDTQQVALVCGGCLALCALVLLVICGTIVLVALIATGWRP